LYIPIGYLLTQAGWEDFPDMDYLFFLYAVVVYIFSWATLLGGIYLAGPEVVEKIKLLSVSVKKKLFGEKK